MLLLSKLAQNWLPWREGHLGVCLRPPQNLQNPDSESSISPWALQELEGFLGWAGSYRGSMGPTGAPWVPRPGAQALFRGLVQQRLAEVAAFAAAASRLAAPMHLLLLHHLLLQRHLLLQQLRLTESGLLPRSL